MSEYSLASSVGSFLHSFGNWPSFRPTIKPILSHYSTHECAHSHINPTINRLKALTAAPPSSCLLVTSQSFFFFFFPLVEPRSRRTMLKCHSPGLLWGDRQQGSAPQMIKLSGRILANCCWLHPGCCPMQTWRCPCHPSPVGEHKLKRWSKKYVDFFPDNF